MVIFYNYGTVYHRVLENRFYTYQTRVLDAWIIEVIKVEIDGEIKWVKLAKDKTCGEAKVV